MQQRQMDRNKQYTMAINNSNISIGTMSAHPAQLLLIVLGALCANARKPATTSVHVVFGNHLVGCL